MASDAADSSSDAADSSKSHRDHTTSEALESSSNETREPAAAKVPTAVTVAVRARPLGPNDEGCLDVTPTSITVNTGREQGSTFAFDYAYDGNATQDDLWNDLGKPILRKAIDGFNGTIFAYGQTGSGKTHTMLGDGGQATLRGDAPIGDDAGIIPRLGEELFFLIDRALAEGTERKFLLTVSYLEIYNEVLVDLLAPSKRATPQIGRAHV